MKIRPDSFSCSRPLQAALQKVCSTALSGQKKTPRVHQDFGIKKSQEHVKRREGGIIV